MDDKSLKRSQRLGMDERLEQRRETPFQWGFHDCLLFPLWLIHPGWAYDHFEAYESLLAGFRYFEIETLEEAGDRVAEWHRGESIEAGFAHRGDLVLVDHPKFTSSFYGAHTGGFVACATEVGWKALDREHLVRAWRLE